MLSPRTKAMVTCAILAGKNCTCNHCLSASFEEHFCDVWMREWDPENLQTFGDFEIPTYSPLVHGILFLICL